MAPYVFAQSKSADLFSVPALPFGESDLDPVISAKTLSFHYGKHHLGYLKKLNAAAADLGWQDMTLEQAMKKAKGDGNQNVFNLAAQTWNHSFYWASMKPKGGGMPTGKLLGAIKDSFGDFDQFVHAFSGTCGSQFGSGWGWLVAVDGKLSVVGTSNAENPMLDGAKPLLVIDVWEHAYYLDYQNRRADYIKAVLDKLINWEFAAANLG
ncbi:MAG: superoxide dismutase [Acidobacteria bacterium]|nr:superoxide dismutase [Acidobacteriota bacterium]